MEEVQTECIGMVTQGIEGQYIEFDEDYNPEDEFERLNGARFVVDPILGMLLSFNFTARDVLLTLSPSLTTRQFLG